MNTAKNDCNNCGLDDCPKCFPVHPTRMDNSADEELHGRIEEYFGSFGSMCHRCKFCVCDNLGVYTCMVIDYSVDLDQCPAMGKSAQDGQRKKR